MAQYHSFPQYQFLHFPILNLVPVLSCPVLNISFLLFIVAVLSFLRGCGIQHGMVFLVQYGYFLEPLPFIKKSSPLLGLFEFVSKYQYVKSTPYSSVTLNY